MKLILIGVLITLFTNTIMAQNNKNINYKSAMTSNEAYTYTPKKEKSIWDTIFDMQKKGKPVVFDTKEPTYTDPPKKNIQIGGIKIGGKFGKHPDFNALKKLFKNN